MHRYTAQGRKVISIHALLAESDNTPVFLVILDNDFYPRSPCGERPPTVAAYSCTLPFLSTLSLRRATKIRCHKRRIVCISIHALLAESDWAGPARNLRKRYFYPRSPCGERQTWWQAKLPVPHFYPRSPCGERQ